MKPVVISPSEGGQTPPTAKEMLHLSFSQGGSVPTLRQLSELKPNGSKNWHILYSFLEVGV